MRIGSAVNLDKVFTNIKIAREREESLMAFKLPQAFLAKKQRILSALSVPVSEYDDLSPKGSIDVGIRDLIDEINSLEGCVTTSSCAGRVSVFLEGRKANEEAEKVGGEDTERAPGQTTAGVGGKGGGGRWLFVSHDPVPDLGASYDQPPSWSTPKNAWFRGLGMTRGPVTEKTQPELSQDYADPEDSEERRFIHFKFEPMILHVLTASLEQAQIVLSAALQAGCRESGALNLTCTSSEPATPMVGIRTMGLALDSIIGFGYNDETTCFVPDWQLQSLVNIANQRFVENAKRIERFRTLLKEMSKGKEKKQGDSGQWEDAGARKERKRAEGLGRARALKEDTRLETVDDSKEIPGLEILEQNS